MMLIFGVLLVVGILALVGAFLISRGNDGSEQIAKVSQGTKAPQTARINEQKPEVKAETPGEGTIALPASQGHKEESAESPYAAVTGQLYELAQQLRKLNMQSTELEQRLSRLTAMMDASEESKAITRVNKPNGSSYERSLDELTTRIR